uniref:Uncharacterized protein n=1 Tax=Sinocyclocheilus rhinocerous TaxID=307959 RepID=A0A673K428_9TELE
LKETAMDRVRLKEMGVTHILNTAAVKKSLKVLLGMPSKEDLLEKVNTGAKYYKGMNITYYGVPVMDDHLFDISKYFFCQIHPQGPQHNMGFMKQIIILNSKLVCQRKLSPEHRFRTSEHRT